jgi:hypothetical protein
MMEDMVLGRLTHREGSSLRQGLLSLISLPCSKLKR